MIAVLDGNVIEVNHDHAVVMTQGVGYEILASSLVLSDLQDLLGSNVRLWIHTHVREDAFHLFGFLSQLEKNFFLQLLKVNGVGPKMALSIMSGARLVQLQEWIEKGDAKALSTLPKVGKKTAEQIILTLQGKLVRVTDLQRELKPSGAGLLGRDLRQAQWPEAHRKISSALVNLGFKSQTVDQFIATLGLEITLEEGVREGLQKLAGHA